MVDQLIFLLLLSFGLLVTSFIIGIWGFIKELKKNPNEYLKFIILNVMIMIFLIPVILGIIQDLN